MKHLRIHSLFLFALLAGCALLGIEKPQSFDERLAYGVSVNTAVRDSADADLNAGRMSSADARDVLAKTDKAREYLDSAREVGDTGIGRGRLTLAVAILTQLQRDKPAVVPFDLQPLME